MVAFADSYVGKIGSTKSRRKSFRKITLLIFVIGLITWVDLLISWFVRLQIDLSQPFADIRIKTQFETDFFADVPHRGVLRENVSDNSPQMTLATHSHQKL